MRLLITGAAGNLGSLLARSLLDSRHELRLMIEFRNGAHELAAGVDFLASRKR